MLIDDELIDEIIEVTLGEAEEQRQAETVPEVGPNCRINVSDKREIVRLNKELHELQRWFEDYGHNGILFPNSIINSFEPRPYALAA